jgi:predicted small integral membrane protein
MTRTCCQMVPIKEHCNVLRVIICMITLTFLSLIVMMLNYSEMNKNNIIIISVLSMCSLFGLAGSLDCCRHTRYIHNNYICSICNTIINGSEKIYRLKCRHNIHVNCFKSKTQTCFSECPVCETLSSYFI